jgi:hypothetical protein
LRGDHSKRDENQQLASDTPLLEYEQHAARDLTQAQRSRKNMEDWMGVIKPTPHGRQGRRVWIDQVLLKCWTVEVSQIGLFHTGTQHDDP